MRKCRYCGRYHEPIPHDKTVILGYDGKYPIIAALAEEGTGFLTFYCQYCKKEHLHGYGDGHRVAHCTEERWGAFGNKYKTNSPFIETGYILNRVSVLGQPFPPSKSKTEETKA